MKESNELKKIVREKYAHIAKETSSCCSCGSNDRKVSDYSEFNENYAQTDGYFKDADLNLGCGLPTEHSEIKEGHIVLDLGSGAGNDVFVARSIVGEKGKIVGLDFTDEMIEKANFNKMKSGFENINFVKGDIEDIPLEDNTFDVVISNCVLNLVPNKEKAFAEIKRVLKDTGHFCISDVVLEGELPENIKNASSMYAGCVSGALQTKDYLSLIEKTGFKDIDIKKKRKINVPDEQLSEFVSKEVLEKYKESGAGIFSITVTAKK